jgi:hypothetical protein
MVASSGAGPKPIPHRLLTTNKLVGAIAYCLGGEAKQAAQAVAMKMRRETGVQAAVASFHRNLPRIISCDVLPDEHAVWTVKGGKVTLKLSKKAAAILVSKAHIDAKRLIVYVESTSPCIVG